MMSVCGVVFPLSNFISIFQNSNIIARMYAYIIRTYEFYGINKSIKNKNIQFLLMFMYSL